MKKFKKNEKGFTLIELLAVIVILAILVAVAIPATMRYLASSRKDTFLSNANQAISAVRNDVAFSGPNKTVTYTLDEINKLLDKKLITSPYGSDYAEGSYVTATFASGIFTYSVCLIDDEGNGISLTEEDVLDVSKVVTGGTAQTCTTPTSDIAQVNEDGSRTTYDGTYSAS